MANISTYPIGTPAAGDLIPGTQLFTDENGKTHNLTKNFTVSQELLSLTRQLDTRYMQLDLTVELEQNLQSIYYKILQD